MINKIIGTTFSRGLMAIFGLLTLILNTRYLGAEKMGELAFLLITIALMVQLSEFIGGPSLVYLQKKFSTPQIITVSHLWSLGIALATFGILIIFKSVFNFPALLISLIILTQAINHTHLHLLVGKEMISGYNLSSVIQSSVVVSGIFISYQFIGATQVWDYLQIYFLGQIIMLFFTSWFVSRIPKSISNNISNWKMAKDIFNYGAIIQGTNLLQFGVYRFNYLILESFTSYSNLGIYSVGNQLSEKVLIPGNAISTVQYSRIANSEEKEKSIDLTFSLIAISAMITLLAIIALLIVPQSVISFILGGEFSTIKSLFFFLAPGVFFMSISTIFSHYFAGLALYKYNFRTSGFGLILSLVLSILLIPLFNLQGAAIATSIVFAGQTLFQITLFKKETEMSWGAIVERFIASSSEIKDMLLNRFK